MEWRSHLIVALTFVVIALSFALAVKTQASTRPPRPSSSSSSPASQSKQKAKPKGKKKAKKAQAGNPSPSKQSELTAEPSSQGQDHTPSSQDAPLRQEDDSSTAPLPTPKASAKSSLADADVPFTPNGTVTYADFEEEEPLAQSASQQTPQEEQWQSVKTKSAASNTPRKVDNTFTSNGQSIASTNPFAILPTTSGNAVKPSSSAARSISLTTKPSGSISSTATPIAKPAASASSTSSSAEQTKRQRQNAAKAAAAKEAKAAEERARVAKLEAHRREAKIERIREEEARKSRKSVQATTGRNRDPFGFRYPICIHCARPASRLYRHYTATLIVLLKCSNPACGCIIDSYADEEYRPRRRYIHTSPPESWPKPTARGRISIGLMDLILVKPRAYRHFLYNLPFLLPDPEDGGDSMGDPTSSDSASEIAEWWIVCKRFVALSLVDAYIRWFYLCVHRQQPNVELLQSPDHTSGPAGLRMAKQWFLPSLVHTATKSLLVNHSQSHGEVVSMLQSYILVWMATAAETFALHSTITALSTAANTFERKLFSPPKPQTGASVSVEEEVSSPSFAPKTSDEGSFTAPGGTRGSTPHQFPTSTVTENGSGYDPAPPNLRFADLYRPHLVPTALLLASLPTLILLSVVLLWESKMPRSGKTHPADNNTEPSVLLRMGALIPGAVLSTLRISGDRAVIDVFGDVSPLFSTDFAVRTLLGGLSAGVCLGVVHPRRPILTTWLLLAGWSAAWCTRIVFTGLPAHMGPNSVYSEGSSMAWTSARDVYCPGW